MCLHSQHFRTEIQKRRKIVQEVQRVMRAAGNDRDAAIAIVEAAVQEKGTLRKYYDFLSKRDGAAAKAAAAASALGAAAASAALAALAQLAPPPAP